MHCECCDKQLTDEEATTRFLTPPGEQYRYTGMCKECLGFLPKDVKLVVRHDLEKEEDYAATEPERLDFTEFPDED